MRRGVLRFSPALLRRSGAAEPAPPAGKTYAEFQAHIATLATDGPIAWRSGLFGGSRAQRTTVGAAGGVMSGSPWLDSVLTGDTEPSRYVQHALPSEAALTAQLGKEVFYNQVAIATGAVSAVARNGFTSTANAGPVSRVICTLFLYFDDATGPMQMNPSTGTGPTPYTW